MIAGDIEDTPSARSGGDWLSEIEEFDEREVGGKGVAGYGAFVEGNSLTAPLRGLGRESVDSGEVEGFVTGRAPELDRINLEV